MIEVSRMKGQRKQPKGKQPPQRSLLSMWQGKQTDKVDEEGKARDGTSTLNGELEMNVAGTAGGSAFESKEAVVVIDCSSTESSSSSTDDRLGERMIRPLPKSGTAPSIKGKERAQPEGTITGSHPPTAPTKMFSIFNKSNKPTTPTSTQTNAASSSTNTAAHPAVENSLAKPVSRQRSQAEEPEIIHITDDERATPFPSQGPGSQEDPITIESSPVKPIKPAVPTHGFFAPRKSAAKAKPDPFAMMKPQLFSAKAPREFYPPWPDGISQHVNGNQNEFFAQQRSCRHSKSTKSVNPSDTNEQLGWLRASAEDVRLYISQNHGISSIRTSSERDEQLQNICASNESLPAIHRFRSTDFLDGASHSTQESWADKWRPRRAEEVLENEGNAMYLRDWLLALEIQVRPSVQSEQVPASQSSATTKASKRKKKDIQEKRPRRRIIREVDKKRLKRRRVDSDEESLDDWIVDDDEPEDCFTDVPPQSEDEIFSGRCTDASSDNDESNTASQVRGGSEILIHSDPTIPNGAPSGSPPRQQEPTKNDFSAASITNCILLLGPPGAGKTAAVYACAEELGWEVFEVYPGIGRRSGGNLDSLVGDVGKNHIVGRASTRPTCASPRKVPASGFSENASSLDGENSILGYFGSNHTFPVEEPMDSRGAADGPAEASDMLRTDSRAMSPSVPGFGFIAAAAPQSSSNKSAPTARQSIILLEEVDILYAEDVNFWPTVVKLVKESMRPVVLTCNDPSVIPLDILPLQAALRFSPCSTSQASMYLRIIALAEGYLLSDESLATIGETPFATLTVDDDDNLSRSTYRHETPVPDLRRAIHHLQFLCCGTTRNGDAHPMIKSLNAPHEIEDKLPNSFSRAIWDEVRETITPDQLHEFQSIRQIASLAEAMSVVDSHVQRRPIAVLNAYETASGESIADYELGHPHLRIGSDMGLSHTGLPFYNHDDSIALETARLARKVVRVPVSRNGSVESHSTRSEADRTEKGSELGHRRATFLSHVSAALTNVVPMVSALPLSAVVMDYEPWVRWMVQRDDEMETEAMQAVIQRPGGRMTRNSQRQSYERYISLGEIEREWMRRSAFGE